MFCYLRINIYNESICLGGALLPPLIYGLLTRFSLAQAEPHPPPTKFFIK